jgi:acyl dehydratase
MTRKSVLVPGQRIVTPSRTITEADLVNWAALSGDWTEIHTNTEHAAKTEFGARIAHGHIALLLSLGLLARADRDWRGRDGSASEVVWKSIRFVAPVFIGDTLFAAHRVVSINSDIEDASHWSDMGTRVTFDVEVFKKPKTLVMKATRTTCYSWDAALTAGSTLGEGEQ